MTIEYFPSRCSLYSSSALSNSNPQNFEGGIFKFCFLLNLKSITEKMMPEADRLITGESHSFQKPSAQGMSQTVQPPIDPPARAAGGGDILAEPAAAGLPPLVSRAIPCPPPEDLSTFRPLLPMQGLFPTSRAPSSGFPGNLLQIVYIDFGFSNPLTRLKELARHELSCNRHL